jgi:hypothetical protein
VREMSGNDRRRRIARSSRVRRWGVLSVLVVGAVVAAFAFAAAGSNGQAAGSEALRLLGLVRLPAGARRSADVPAGAGAVLSYPPSVPVVPRLVDLHEFFVVPGTPGSMIDWVEAHRPAGAERGDFGRSAAAPMGCGAVSCASSCCASAHEGRWISLEFGATRSVGPRELVVDAVQLRGGVVGVRVDAQVASLPKLPGTGAGPSAVRIVASGIGSDTFELRCDPAGGTVPDPARICAAILADPALLYSFPGPNHSCPAGSPVISIAGTRNHKPLHSTFSACTGGQEQQAAEWAALLQARPSGRSSLRPSLHAGHAAPALLAGGSATAIIGGTVAERSLLRSILAALSPTHVPLLRVVRAHGGVKLEAPALAIRPTWGVTVTGAVFFDRSAAQHLPPVLEVDVGQVGWPTFDAGPRPPAATPTSVLATRRTMRRLALASGARIEELTVSAPDALAVVLRLQVKNAARFLHDRLRTLVLSADAHEARYDGLLIDVDDTRGIAWADGQTQLGGESYVRPSLSGCNPFPPPGPASPAYERCPG